VLVLLTRMVLIGKVPERNAPAVLDICYTILNPSAGENHNRQLWFSKMASKCPPNVLQMSSTVVLPMPD